MTLWTGNQNAPSLAHFQPNSSASFGQSGFGPSPSTRPAERPFDPLFFQVYAKPYCPANWVLRGSEAILSSKGLKQHKFAFPSGSAFQLIFLIFFVKVVVPLTGFEPVTPSLRMELRGRVKVIYYMALMVICDQPAAQTQTLPKSA